MWVFKEIVVVAFVVVLSLFLIPVPGLRARRRVLDSMPAVFRRVVVLFVRTVVLLMILAIGVANVPPKQLPVTPLLRHPTLICLVLDFSGLRVTSMLPTVLTLVSLSSVLGPLVKFRVPRL